MNRFRLPALCALAALVCSCSTAQVGFKRLPPPGPGEMDRYKALNSLYVLVDVSQAKGSSDARLYAENADRFGEALAGLDAWVSAYRVTDEADAPDPFLDVLSPAAILRVSPSVPNASRFVSSDTCTHTLTVTARARLTSHPGGLPLADFTEAWSATHAHKIDAGDRSGGFLKSLVEEALSGDESQYDQLKAADVGDLAMGVARRLVGPAREVKRPIFRKDKDAESEKAFDAAGAGHWPKAEYLWQKRMDAGRGDWRDWLGLAVAAERRRDWPRSRDCYLKAREGAGGHRRVPWDAILADLAQAEALDKEAPRSVPPLFGKRAAVLPFSDETNSVDGPEFLRALAAERLKDGGWNTMPPEEVDAKLREHGISQGGQLRAVQPAEVARWLGTDFLLFGHITEFKEVPLGAYHRRAVKGRLALWDAAAGGESWSRETSVDERSVGTKNIGARLVGQLVGGLFERIAKSPLGDESRRFVGASLASLPMRPSR